MQVHNNHVKVDSSNVEINIDISTWKGWGVKKTQEITELFKKIFSIFQNMFHYFFNPPSSKENSVRSSTKSSSTQQKPLSISQGLKSSTTSQQDPTSLKSSKPSTSATSKKKTIPTIDKTNVAANWALVEEQMRELLAHYGMKSDKISQPIDVYDINDVSISGLRMQFIESEMRGEDRKIRKIFFELSGHQSAESDSDGFVAIFSNGVDAFLKNLFDKSSWPQNI